MRRNVILALVAALTWMSCSKKEDTASKPADSLTCRVEHAPEWTALLQRTSGWFGSDGIFAIPYSGRDQAATSSDSVLVVFSDTMVGEIVNGKLQPGYKMVNNSVAILKGGEPKNENARFLIAKNEKNEPASVFVPKTPMTKPGDYYWLGDGFVNPAVDSNFYIFAYRIRNTNDGSNFPFKEVGNALLVIPNKSKFPFADQRQLDVPFFSNEDDSLYSSVGAAVLVNTKEAGAAQADGYVYVYSVRGPAKELIVCRVKPEAIETFASWEFWDGTGWSNNIRETMPIADSVSNELSVTLLPNNKYALVYQYAGIFPTICMQIGESPVGPFGEREKIWDTKKDIADPDLFTYNAKAHPALSKPGELLISYNVNSFKFLDVIERIPDLYRPRFIRLVFDKK